MRYLRERYRYFWSHSGTVIVNDVALRKIA